MELLSSGPSIVLYHIVPSFVSGFFYYILAIFLIFVFRVKKASFKFIIHVTVLYKVFLSLITGANFSNLIITKPFNFGIAFYDPLHLIPFGHIGPLPDVKINLIQSPFVSTLISMVLLTIVVLILFRWGATSFFIRRAVKEGEFAKKNLDIIKSNLAAKFNIRPPKIIISNKDLGPLVIGFFKPTVILPKKILSTLSINEINAVIGHELAHIKRKDNLLQWVTLFLKDILFFNPFARSTYKKIILNKEISTDNLLTKAPFNIDENSLSKTIKKVNEINGGLAKDKNILIAKASFSKPGLLKMRLRSLRGKQKNSWPQNILSYACLFFFFGFKIWFAINLGGKALMLLP